MQNRIIRRKARVVQGNTVMFWKAAGENNADYFMILANLALIYLAILQTPYKNMAKSMHNLTTNFDDRKS